MADGDAPAKSDAPRVVVVGGGFGGLFAARELGRRRIAVTAIDRNNHHLFQPLLYQVAMAGLAPADIASPIRSILRDLPTVRVLLGNVTQIRLADRCVVTDDGEVRYDYLIVATGAQNHYFGHDDWERFAPGLKSIEDAIEIRRRILTAFERAETSKSEEEIRRLLTFVVIGGGPTGVEMAGALAELSRWVLAREFRRIDPKKTRVILLDAGHRILTAFDETLSSRALGQLTDLGVEVRSGVMVTDIRKGAVQIGDESIEAETVVWGAGVAPTDILASLGTPLDRAGRVIVEPDLTVPGHPEAYVIGDAACFVVKGKALPGVSPVAIQQALAAADNIARSIAGHDHLDFRYIDKGSMATIGRSRAIAHMGAVRLSGFVAWVAWGVVHIWYLIGFRNRLSVMLNWFWQYLTYRRGSRLITHAWAPRLSEPRKP